MNANEAEAVLALAKARTPGERHDALRRVHRAAQRLDAAVHAELTTLVNETSSYSTHAFRPMAATRLGSLATIEPGEDPFMPPAAEALVDEWVACWKDEKTLRKNGLTLAGPMLVCGPPGTGKSTLVRALARRLAPMPMFVLDAHAVVRSHLGESGERLVEAFRAMRESGALALEEIDALGTRRGGKEDVQESVRTTIAFLRMLDEHQESFPIVMTTNRVEAIDAALVRRCEYVVELPEPSAPLRDAILSRVLGVPCVPSEALGMPLTVAVPIAKRARRLAVMAQKDPVATMRELIGAAS